MSTKALSTTGLEETLREVLPETSLVLEDGTHLVDGVKPQFTATPSSSAELADVLACANEHDAAIIPWGAGSSMLLGNVPERYDIALSTARLDRVIEYEPADLTVTVEAGLTLAKLQELLKEHGQFLPIDGPSQATIGGLLAVGHGGPSQQAYGRPRDWLLGCRIALVDGTVVHTGGRVVKNVAGYDLSRMMVGSLGTLGVIVEVTLKVAPLPAREETLLIAHADMVEACDAIRAIAKRGLALRTACVVGNKAAYWPSVPAPALARTRRELAETIHVTVQRMGHFRQSHGDRAGNDQEQLVVRPVGLHQKLFVSDLGIIEIADKLQVPEALLVINRHITRGHVDFALHAFARLQAFDDML